MPLEFHWRRWAILSLSLGSGLGFSLCISAGGVPWRGVLALFFLCFLSLLLGQAISRLLRIPAQPGVLAPLEVGGGFAALATLQTGAVFGLNLNALGAMAVSAAITAAVAAWAFTRKPAEENEGAGGRSDLIDGALLVGIALLAALWSREVLVALRGTEASGVFNAHQDFFFHAGMINYLREHPVFFGQSPEMAGMPPIPYHYASYALPAVYCELGGARPLEVADGLWLPAGVMLAGLGVYAFGSALAGRKAGAFAAAALFLLPDASHYGLANTFFGVEWLLEISPALGYGIALILLGLTLFVLGFRQSRWDWILAGAGLVAASTVFKLQTAVPALLLYAFLFLAAWKPRRPAHRWAVILALGAFAVAAALLSEHARIVPKALSGRHAFREVFDFCAEWVGRPYARWYAAHIARGPPAVGVPVGLAFLILSAFGALLPAAALLAIWPRRPRQPWPIACIPFASLGAYVAVIFLVPTPTYDGDATEFGQRPFVLVYAILVAFVAAGLTGWVPRQPRFRPAGRWLGAAASAVALGWAWAWSGSLQQSWHLFYLTRVPVAPGELEAAAYIRERAAPNDVVLSSDGDPYGVAFGLTERQAFLTFYPTFLLIRGRDDPLIQSRLRLGGQLQGMRRYEELKQFGDRYHIRWFLLEPGEMRNWPAAMLGHCRFENRGSRVFDLASGG